MARIVGYNKHPGSQWPQIGLILAILLLIFVTVVLVNIFAAQNKAPLEKIQPAKQTTSSTSTSSSSTTSSTVVSSIVVSSKEKVEERKKQERAMIQEESNLLTKAKTTLDQIVFSSRVDENNLPVDSLSEITADQAGRVYCYTKILTDEVPQTIHHVWLNPQGQKIADIKLELHNREANTWSYVNLYGQTAGQWTVEVVDSAGQVLGKKSFLLK